MIALSVPVLLSRGGEEDPQIRVIAPKAIPVGKTLIAKAEPVTSIPGSGIWVWKIKTGSSLCEPPQLHGSAQGGDPCGVIRLITPSFDPSLDPGSVKVHGVKPGKVKLVAEYVVGARHALPLQGDEQVVASASQTVVVFSALIETDGEAVEGQPEPVTLAVSPPPDPMLEFQLDGTTLTLVSAAGDIIFQKAYPAASFSPDPLDPSRLICPASFTAPLGTAGAPGVALHFVASALIIDPDTGFPKIVEASDEKPIVVKPAGVEPPLSVSFTPPCDPFVVEPGASTSISIEIRTSDKAGTTASFRILREDGTEVFSCPIPLPPGQDGGEGVISVIFPFIAPSPTGNYIIEVHAFRGPESAIASGGMTVQAPMPPLAVHVSTPSPLVKVEGDPAEVSFTITPPEAKPLITGLKWRVEPWGQPGVPLFGAVLDPAMLVDRGTYLEGAFSFTVPEGLVDEPTDFVLRVMAGGEGIGEADDWIILRVSPKPPIPLALTIFSAPEAPVYETEEVSFGFFIAPKDVLPSITGVFWQVLDGASGETLIAGNVPPESLEANGYLSGACTFEVLNGLHRASGGTGAVLLRITVFTADGEAHDEQAFVVKAAPSLMVLEPFVLCREGVETDPIGIELSPGDAGVETLSFAVLSGDLVIQRGDLDPAILAPVNGVLRGSFAFVPAAGTLEAARTGALTLRVSAGILGFPRLVSDAVPLYVATASPPGQGGRLGVFITNEEPVLTVQEKRCIAVRLRVEGIETLDELFYLYVLIKAPGATLEDRLLDTSFLARSAPRTFEGTARVIVPLGSAGLPGIRVFITGFTRFDLSTDSRPVEVTPYPKNEVAYLTLLTPNFMRVKVRTRSEPVRIRATNIDGLPIPGITLRPEPPEGIARIEPPAAQTGADGVATFEVEPVGSCCDYPVPVPTPIPEPEPSVTPRPPPCGQRPSAGGGSILTPGGLPAPFPGQGGGLWPPGPVTPASGQNLLARWLTSASPDVGGVCTGDQYFSALNGTGYWYATPMGIPQSVEQAYPVRLMVKIYADCDSIRDLGAEAMPAQEAAEFAGLVGSFEAAAESGNAAGAEAAAGRIFTFLERQVAEGDLLLANARLLANWLENAEEISDTEHPNRKTADVNAPETLETPAPACACQVDYHEPGDWHEEPDSPASGPDGFMRTYVEPDKEVIVPAGFNLLVTVPNKDKDKECAWCFGDEAYGSLESGDLPMHEWRRDQLEFGSLWPPKPTEKDKEDILAPVIVYGAEEDEVKAKGGHEKIYVVVRDSPQQVQEALTAELAVTVVAVEKELKGALVDNGDGTKTLTLTATTVPGEQKYGWYVIWYVNGEPCGRGHSFTITPRSGQDYYIRAWCGLSRSEAKLYPGPEPKAGETAEPPGKAVDEAAYQKLKNLIEQRRKENEQYVSSVDVAWKGYKPNATWKYWFWSLHPAEDTEVTLITDDVHPDGNIYVTVHSPLQRYDTAARQPFSYVYAGPRQKVKLHSPAVDFDYFVLAYCDHGSFAYEDPFQRVGDGVRDTFTLKNTPGAGDFKGKADGTPNRIQEGEYEAQEGPTPMGERVEIESEGDDDGCFYKDEKGNKERRRSIYFNVVKARLGLCDLAGQELEEGRPSFVFVNNNDSNLNGREDYLEFARVANEKDLLKIILRIDNEEPTEGSLRLTWPGGLLRIWKNEDKGEILQSDEAEGKGEHEWNLARPKPEGGQDPLPPVIPEQGLELWVEGIDPGEAQLDLILLDVLGNEMAKVSGIIKVVKMDLEIYWPGDAGMVEEEKEEVPGGISGPTVRTKLVIKKPEGVRGLPLEAVLSVVEGEEKIGLFESEMSDKALELPCVLGFEQIPQEGKELWIEGRAADGLSSLVLGARVIAPPLLSPAASSPSTGTQAKKRTTQTAPSGDPYAPKEEQKKGAGQDKVTVHFHAPDVSGKIVTAMNRDVREVWLDAPLKPRVLEGVPANAVDALKTILYREGALRAEWDPSALITTVAYRYSLERKKLRVTMTPGDKRVGKAKISFFYEVPDVPRIDVGDVTALVDTIETFTVSGGAGQPSASRTNLFTEAMPGPYFADRFLEQTQLTGDDPVFFVLPPGQTTARVNLAQSTLLRRKIHDGLENTDIRYAVRAKGQQAVLSSGSFTGAGAAGCDLGSGMYEIDAGPGRDGLPSPLMGHITIQAYIVGLEMEINDTPAVDDDVVPRKSASPPLRLQVPCRIRAPQFRAGQKLTVHLSNEPGNGEIRFPRPQDTSVTVELVGDKWSHFNVSGEIESPSTGDARIQARYKDATGKLLAEKPATVLWVAVEARFAVNDVSANNPRRAVYEGRFGTDSLGPMTTTASTDPPGLVRYGVEIVGHVSPRDIPHPINFRRDIISRRVYNDNVADSTESHNESQPGLPDNSLLQWVDHDPTPDGTIFDLDAPGLRLAMFPGETVLKSRRRRCNFEQWSEWRGMRCSDRIAWFDRQSIRREASTGLWDRDWAISTDNQAGSGRTVLTWDLR